MDEIVNKFLLARDKFMLEMHLNSLDLTTVLVEHLLKAKNKYKNLKKQEIQHIFIKTK